MRSFPFTLKHAQKKTRTGSYSIEYTQTNVQTHFCWKRISLCLYFVLLSNSQKKQRSRGILSAGNLKFTPSKSKRSSHGNTRSHHLYTPGVTWRSLENPPFENGGTSIFPSTHSWWDFPVIVMLFFGWVGCQLEKVDGATPMYCLIMSPHRKPPPCL